MFKDPIVTEVAPLRGFHEAEAYHQNYYNLHPNQPYIVINDRPKVEALKARFRVALEVVMRNDDQ